MEPPGDAPVGREQEAQRRGGHASGRREHGELATPRRPQRRRPQHLRQAIEQQGQQRDVNHVAEVRAARDAQQIEEQEQRRPPPGDGGQKAVEAPQRQRYPLHEQHRQMAHLVPAERREGEHAAAEERRRPGEAASPQHVAAAPPAQHERREQQQVVGEDRVRRQRHGRRGSNAGAQQVVRERQGVPLRVEERRIPQAGEAAVDLVRHPLQEIEVEDRIVRIGRDVGAEAAPDRAQVEQGEAAVGGEDRGLPTPARRRRRRVLSSTRRRAGGGRYRPTASV